MSVAGTSNSLVDNHVDADLPQGWVSTIIGDAFAINPRKVAADALPVNASVTFVPMPAVDADSGAITAAEEREFSAVRKGYTSFVDDDVIVAKITPCMENGKAAVARNLTNGLGFGSTEFHVLRPIGAALSEYVYHFVRQESFRREAEQYMTGTVGQKRVPPEFIKESLLPLPPLAEQQRIVAKVEALLERVRAARERLAKVPAILRRFRQSVLAAACSGQLTADWRDSHVALTPAAELLKDTTSSDGRKRRAGRLWGAGVVPELTDEERESIPELWTWAKARDLGHTREGSVQVGPMSMRSKDFVDDGVPVLNVGCVQWGYFDESKLNYLPPHIAPGFERYRIAEGDILFTRSGTVGRSAVATVRQDGYLMTFHLLRARPAPAKVLSQYLYFAFRGAPSIGRQTEEAAIGSTRAGFNTRLLADLDVPLPPMEEQHEILRRVDSLFGVADKIEQRVAAATARAEKLAQSILAKAFRGELVPTEAELARRERRDYEPASVLLERIRAERARFHADPKRKRRARTRKRTRPP